MQPPGNPKIQIFCTYSSEVIESADFFEAKNSFLEAGNAKKIQFETKNFVIE